MPVRESDNDGEIARATYHYPNEQDGNPRTPLLNKTRSGAPSTSGFTKTVGLLLQDWWLWELLAALTASLATTAIIVVLVVYDGSSLPDFPSVITLNSVISFFAVIAKLAFTSAVGSSLSQSKWLWFRQGEARPLEDLQIFDDASRGPWGAMTLILNLKARHLAFVGATITVLLLLFDPFLQQVVVYPDRLIPSEKVASIARAQRYQARSDEGLALPSVVDMSMKAAVYSGIFDIDDQADIQVDHSCPTGNCTWEDFSSLAVCSKCANITSYIEKSCNSTGCHQLSLPGGPTLSGLGGQINSTVSNISAELTDIEASVVQFSSLISKTRNNVAETAAWECALFYCVNTYFASVMDGAIQQRISKSQRNDSATYTGNADLEYHSPSGNGSDFRVDNLAAKAMNAFMSSSFTGSGGINSTTSTSGPAFSSDVIHALYDTRNYSRRIENLAISMTNNIRQQKDGSSSTFEGLALKTETYVKVRWAWFSYPAFVITSSLLYLLGTILETTYRDVSIWKSNNMVMLFHGRVMGLDSPENVPVTTVSGMRRLYEGVKVKLIRRDDGDDWKFVQKLAE